MVGAWVVILVAVTVGHRAFGGTYDDDFSLPGSAAAQGADLLKAHNPGAGGQSGQLVFTVSSGSITAQQTPVENAAAQVRKLPHVLAVSDPLSQATTAKDGKTAYATVNFDVNPVSLGADYVTQVDNATAVARSAGVAVSYGGLLGQAAQPKTSDLRSELIGIIAAIIVLLLGFGSVIAAGLPIAAAVIGAIAGLGVLGMVAAATSFASVSPTLAVMMGLGVGIDYALFLATRHRQLVMDGTGPADAAGATIATSGRSVLIAAATVIIAVLGLYASGISFIGKLGVAAAIAVAVAALCSVTLVPALLGLAAGGSTGTACGGRSRRLRPPGIIRAPTSGAAIRTGSAGIPGWPCAAASPCCWCSRSRCCHCDSVTSTRAPARRAIRAARPSTPSATGSGWAPTVLSPSPCRLTRPKPARPHRSAP